MSEMVEFRDENEQKLHAMLRPGDYILMATGLMVKVLDVFPNRCAELETITSFGKMTREKLLEMAGSDGSEEENLLKNMAFRSIVVEMDAENTVTLLQLTEENWTTAQQMHDALRETVTRRGSKILYSSLMNLEGAGTSCCGQKEVSRVLA